MLSTTILSLTLKLDAGVAGEKSKSLRAEQSGLPFSTF